MDQDTRPVHPAGADTERAVFQLADVPVNEEIELPGILGPNMVLQREANLKIWGMCRHDGEVAVGIGDENFYGMCREGRFEVAIGPFEAGGPYQVEIGNQHGKVALDNVLIGDVFLASGQSNMLMTMEHSRLEGEGENDQLRFYLSTPNTSMTPLETTSDNWVNTDLFSTPYISAAAYYFGHTLQKRYEIPIGIVVAAQGNTILSTWAPQAEIASMPTAYQDHTQLNRTPSVFYNAMIHPLRKMKFTGVLWYQGEEQPQQYDELLAALIGGWRRAFQDDQLHFTIVQLPRWGRADAESWSVIREHQKAAAQRMERATYSVNIDLGDREDLHPLDKKPLGIRAAWAAMQSLYGEPGVWRGPELASYWLNGREIVLSFEHSGSGLQLTAGATGFEIADENGHYLQANAEVRGDTVAIWHDAIERPSAARYAYGAYPDVTLYNEEGLPAEPFRIRLEH